MANIFKQNLDTHESPNRNNHDLTHKVHGTYKMGLLYPFLCKPVVPGDSFRIDTAVGMQAMPMPFPTQSNVRAIFHYFYVRNKNLWENWENWLQGLEEHTPPFIDQPASFYKTGSLADYLDVPTSFVSNGISSITSSSYISAVIPPTSSIVYYSSFGVFSTSVDFGPLPLSTYVDTSSSNITNSSYSLSLCLKPIPIFIGNIEYLVSCIGSSSNSSLFHELHSEDVSFVLFSRPKSATGTSLDNFYLYDPFVVSYRSYLTPNNDGTASISIRDIDDFRKTVSLHAVERPDYDLFVGIRFFTSVLKKEIKRTSELFSWTFKYEVADSEDLSSNPSFSPYFYSGNVDNSDSIRLSALPFRAYESIYYAYYSNSVLQPLVVNGQEKFNRYNTELGDGADTTDYHLFRRNWELDAYTSCLPSPQQGNAPLVGMNVLGDVTLEDPDTGAITTAHTRVDGENVSLEVTSPLQSIEHGRTMVNLLNSGFSIADLRQTNNLTRFLEQSLRSGYRYIDFIFGQSGVKPRYAEMDMPEFLGGFTARLDVNKVTNTNGVVPDGDGAVLGQFAGNGSLFGGSQHGISRFFDDYGFIVGIMCIVPDTSYSQLLPKHFNINSRLDYYFPVFSEVGLQPITYEEVCPIESHADYALGDKSKKLTDTFGYQRPNHDLVWYPDTVHGQLRLSLKDILVNRVFSGRPELGREFLEIDAEDTNRIFSVTAPDNDVFIGQIAIKITAKRPVPRIVIPSLGR